jgi:hypothetical protein
MPRRTRSPLTLLAALAALAACRPPSQPGLDLEGPLLLGSDLVPGEELGPSDPIRLRFSEPVDAATALERIVLVPFELGEPCTQVGGCPAGWRCHRSRCQRDPVSQAWLADLATPPLAAARRARTAPLVVAADVTATELTLRSQRPLEPHRLHALLVGPVLDQAGNEAQPEGPGSLLALCEVFASGGAERALPSLTLVSPAEGDEAVPPNLARVVVRASRPVHGVEPGALWLELASGARVELAPRSAGLCAGEEPGRCFVLAPALALPPLSRVELRASRAIRDALGRPLHEAEQPGPVAAAFATAAGRDLVPPRLEALELRLADRCLVTRARSDEPADLVIDGDWAVSAASVGATRHELGVASPAGPGSLALELVDLAGNRTALAPRSIDGSSPPPRIAISEVLANPAGPEPAQELVELVNLESAELDLAGFQLDDGDDGIAVDILPAARLPPGGYAVVVGAKYSLDGFLDPRPAASALVVRLAGTLGDGGLANGGERVVLRDPSGRLVSSFGAHHGATSSGQSVERLEATRCDLARSWRPRPDGRSSPGWPADP